MVSPYSPQHPQIQSENHASNKEKTAGGSYIGTQLETNRVNCGWAILETLVMCVSNYQVFLFYEALNTS